MATAASRAVTSAAAPFVSRSTIIVAAIFGLFVFYTAAKGDIGQYLGALGI